MYPNPTNGFVRIAWKSVKGDVSVSVKDIAGKVVYNTGYRTANTLNSLDLRHLQDGVYFIELNTVSGTQVEKVVILK